MHPGPWGIFILFYLLVVVVPFWKIFPRANMPAWLSLFMLIPLVNVILLWTLAFKRWPGDASNG